jgi:hypothetical protein
VVDLGYARVSTAKQDLDRQVDALQQAGIAPERIYLDKKSGATTDRPGLTAALAYARAGDVLVVHTLDRLGWTVRDTLNLIHDLTERGVPDLGERHLLIAPLAAWQEGPQVSGGALAILSVRPVRFGVPLRGVMRHMIVPLPRGGVPQAVTSSEGRTP